MTKSATKEQVEELQKEINKVLDKATDKITKLLKNGRENGVKLMAFYELTCELTCELTTVDSEGGEGFTAMSSMSNDPSSIRTLRNKMDLVLRALEQVQKAHENRDRKALEKFVEQMPVNLRDLAVLDKTLSEAREAMKILGVVKVLQELT